MPDGEGPTPSTPGRDLPAFTSTLSVAKHRRLATPFTSNTPDALLPFHPSHLHLHDLSAFLLSLFCVSFQPCLKEKITCPGLCSGNKHTHTTSFFCHNTSHLSSPNSSSLFFFFCDPTEQQVHPTPPRLTPSSVIYFWSSAPTLPAHFLLIKLWTFFPRTINFPPCSRNMIAPPGGQTQASLFISTQRELIKFLIENSI